MRIGSLAFVGVFAMSLGVAAAGACGSSVTTETGATGSGGTGGAATTTVVTATSTVSTTVTSTASTTSTTSGGGDSCMQACDHIQTCTGFNACAQISLTCPAQKCAADCINAIPCANLSIQSGQACFAMCAPDSGPPADAGDVCMQACAHVQQCFGFDVCAQLGMQLDCSNPQNQCIAQCIDNTSCGMLNMQTFQACQSMCQTAGDGGMPTDGGGTTDGGGATDGGGSAQACQMCAVQSCGQQLFQCNQSMTCQPWLNCVMGCSTPSCFTGCDAANPNAKMEYDAIYTCSCNSCMSQCGSISDPCGTH